MKVLMLGWEFPPVIAGGLGVACKDLSKGLQAEGTDITFVMPSVPQGASSPFAKLRGANEVDIKIRRVDSILTPYMNETTYHESVFRVRKNHPATLYGNNIGEEIERYTKAAAQIAREEPHDVIHAHDWMTFRAAIQAKKRSKKPMVAHVHATEYDRTGGKPNEYIKRVEQEGLDSADHIITISDYMKRQIIKHYGAPAGKISVIHWGIDPEWVTQAPRAKSPFANREQVVLFLGRMTLQKGPDYFVQAAKDVLKFAPKTRFVMAGDGDMMGRIINSVIDAGMQDRFSFTGFLRGDDVRKAYQLADCYVMPSVSEPFGLVALEAIASGVPVILSKTSGASEVVKNALRVDFWDTKMMASKIIGVLRHKTMSQEMRCNGRKEVENLNLRTPAKKTLDVYKRLGIGG